MAQSIDKSVETNIMRYIEKVKQHYKVDSAILFGSYAKGLNTKDSDIDIAIISPDIKDKYDDMAVLMGLTWGIDTRIEPHPIKSEDYELREDYFIKEIINSGIDLPI